MNRFKLILNVLALLVASAGVAFADGFADVKYPIAELGGCKDKVACQRYCENTDNMSVCIDYGGAKGLITSEEARISKLAADRIKAGTTPGKCKSKDECENYCSSNVSAIKECIAFGEEMGAIPPEELAQAKKVAAALEAGAKMPGSCTDKKSCESYCEGGEHIDECLSFAEAADLIPSDQLAEAKKVAKFLKNGETPGKCTTKESCDAYCAKDSNFEECIGFAEKAGLVSKEDADIAKKIGGKGPGGCKGKDSCEAYCNDEQHADECLNFAIDKGLVPEEDLQKIKEGPDKIRKGLEQVPADVRATIEGCLRDTLGAANYDKFMQGGGGVTKNSGDKIEKCFNDTMAGYAQKKMQNAKNGQGLPEGVNPEDFKNGAPSAEQIQKIKEQMMKNAPGGKLPDGVDVEQFKNGAPSVEDIEKIKAEYAPQIQQGNLPGGIKVEGYGTRPPTADEIEKIKEDAIKNLPGGGSIPQGVPAGYGAPAGIPAGYGPNY